MVSQHASRRQTACRARVVRLERAGRACRTSRRSRKGLNLAVQPWTVFHLGDGEDVLIAEGQSLEVSDPDQLEESNNGTATSTLNRSLVSERSLWRIRR